MRLDKFLKVSRIIKRRTVANEVCSARRVSVNDRVAKAACEVNVGDILEIKMGQNLLKIEVLSTPEFTKKENAEKMYRSL